MTTSSLTARAGAASSFHPGRFLRGAWAVDAAGSAATAAGMIALSGPIAAWTGLSTAFLVGCALLFVPYVALLAWLARRDRVARTVAWLPVELNVAWGAVCLAIAATTATTAWGTAFLAVHVAWGLGFAALQFLGVRRSTA